MKKIIYLFSYNLLIFMWLMVETAFGQTQFANSQSIEEIVSPVKNALLKSNDTSDIVVKLRNHGPNDLFSTDQIEITLSINVEGQGAILTLDTVLPFGKYVQKNDFLNFTIIKDYQFTQDNRYSICASAGGTRIYPINSNKFNSACTPFSVGLQELEIKVSNVYYSNGKLFFSLNNIPDARLEIYDMAGKIVLDKRIQARDSYIDFNPKSKGFYFLKVVNIRHSANAVAKIAVN
tara:strand:- start:2204 stop:2905 length:702 start_codon:yes stop_codon:yes gene_type:complete